MYSKIKYDNGRVVADFSCVFELPNEQLVENIRNAVTNNITIQELDSTETVEVIFSADQYGEVLSSLVSTLSEKTFDELINIIHSSIIIGIVGCEVYEYGPEPTRFSIWLSNSDVPSLSMSVEQVKEFNSAQRLYYYIKGFVDVKDKNEMFTITCKFNHLSIDVHQYICSKSMSLDTIVKCIVLQLQEVFNLELDGISKFESELSEYTSRTKLKHDRLLLEVMFGEEYKTMISLYPSCMEDFELNYDYFYGMFSPVCLYYVVGNTEPVNMRMLYVSDDGSEIYEVGKNNLANTDEIISFVHEALEVIIPDTKYAEQFSKGSEELD